jgi:uncharacterized membrane protein
MNNGNYTPANDNTKLYSILSYIWILFIVGIIAAPNNEKVRFHANQGLVLFLAEMVLGFLVRTASAFGHFFNFNMFWYFDFLGFAIGVLMFVFMIIGIVNAANDDMKPLPIIGGIKIL